MLRICDQTCEHRNDNNCDDGGPGSNFDWCDYGKFWYWYLTKANKFNVCLSFDRWNILFCFCWVCIDRYWLLWLWNPPTRGQLRRRGLVRRRPKCWRVKTSQPTKQYANSHVGSSIENYVVVILIKFEAMFGHVFLSQRWGLWWRRSRTRVRILRLRYLLGFNSWSYLVKIYKMNFRARLLWYDLCWYSRYWLQWLLFQKAEQTWMRG